jgi:hypothetical protein
MSDVYFTLPTILGNWPWPLKLNPHYEECKEELAARWKSFCAFSPKAQDAFNKCHFGMYGSLPTSYASKYTLCLDLLTSMTFPQLKKGFLHDFNPTICTDSDRL